MLSREPENAGTRPGRPGQRHRRLKTKVLLVNPNRYHQPPVPPLALEHLERSLRDSGHECEIADLCFADDPEERLIETIRSFRPGLAGVTVRNIDTGTFQNRLFFLDDIARLVSVVRREGVPVVAGGAGFSIAPEAILARLGADWGVRGPGEGALPLLAGSLERGNAPPAGRVMDGWPKMPRETPCPDRRGSGVDYHRYLEQGGLAGFETQKGCLGRCPFCPEASGRVLFRRPEDVVSEIAGLAAGGVREYHLCDSEFNQEPEFCRRFLELLIGADTGISWSLYMKTRPFDEKLFSLLAASGARLITLTLFNEPGSMEDAAEICAMAHDNGIRLAVDYLCGFPGQDETEVAGHLERLREIGPDSVGLNSYIRVYPGTPLARRLAREKPSPGELAGELEDNQDMVLPLFFCSIPTPRLREFAAGDPLFKIEGFERSTNYERLRQG